MESIYYEVSFPMKPEMEKKDYFCDPYDYELTYRVPKMYFECTGKAFDSKSSLEWSDDSLVVFKNDCIVKYTESNFYDVLVKGTEDPKHWFESRDADIYGFYDDDVEDAIERKLYTVEEYDLKKSEKRKYRFVESTNSKMNDIDKEQVQRWIDKMKKYGMEEYVLTEN